MTAAATDTLTMKVFQLNQSDWWAGSDLDSVIAAFRAELGADATIDNPHELSDEELDRLKFVDGDDPINSDGTPGGWRTFREELARSVAVGQTFPCFFASTEW